MAKWLFEDEASIPEDLKDHVEKGTGEYEGKFFVNVVANAKLKDFRDTNISVRKDLEKAEGTLKTLRGALGLKEDEEIDADEIGTKLGELREIAQKVADNKLQGSDAIEAEVNKRIEKMKEKFEEDKRGLSVAHGDLKRRADELERALDRKEIDASLVGVVSDDDIGVSPWAYKYIVQEAYSLFEVDRETKKLVPKRGGSVVYGESGGEPMTVKEWVDGELRKSNPEFFKKSAGGGADGGGDKSTFGYSREAFDALPAEKRLELVNNASLGKRS
jgi:hypothetical protein